MSDLERDNEREEPAEITTFVAEDPLLIDPAHGRATQTYTPRKPRKWLPLFLFVATCVSTFLVGSFGIGLTNPESLAKAVSERGLSQLLYDGMLYSAAVMSILLAHEMGHYLIAKYHKVPASLPYFIPMPFSPLGTMGAVIVQGRGVANRKEMFDIAIAGPLAGLVLALPITWLGVQREPFGGTVEGGEIMYGLPALVKWFFMQAHPEQTFVGNLVLVNPNPLLMAGWVGILVTALNLIPIGQLDGGHILYCLIGKHAHRIAMGLLFFAIAWMVYTGNLVYMLLVVLLLVFGPRHPPTADDSVPIGPLRVGMGWLTLAFIFIGFTPNPIGQSAPQPEPTAPAEGELVQRLEDPSNSTLPPQTASRGGHPHGPSLLNNPNNHSTAGLAISSGIGFVEGNSLIRRFRNSIGEPSDSRQM